MIKRLMDEAAAAATHKAWCDKEMAETNAKKDDKEADLAKLNTKIEQATARSTTLKEELAELAATQAEMDKMRAEEKAAYEKNRPEMEMGVEGGGEGGLREEPARDGDG